LAIPAAADPAMPGEKHVTAAATGRDATDSLSNPVPAGKFLKSVETMTSHPKIFELLKEFMDRDGQSERWITVQEFRNYFQLKKSCSPVISGYFQRIYQNPTYLCPYRVIKIEQIRDPANPYRSVRRYLVKKSLGVPVENAQKGIRNPFFF
jgi:hypothetical protein